MKIRITPIETKTGQSMESEVHEKNWASEEEARAEVEQWFV